MSCAQYNFEPGKFEVTEEIKKDYVKYGYILVRNILDKEELDNILKVFEGSDMIEKHGYGMADGRGKKAKLVMWNHAGDDVTGMLGRCEKVVNTCEKLLDWGEIYHYHSKLMRKDAFEGGSHLWHQDYGYWYQNGCLFPDLITVFLPLDKTDRENGCLEILRGSHKCGRIKHIIEAGQMMADIERINAIREKCPHEYVDMNPGDALFFHSNLIHSSAANNSPRRRWALLQCYCPKANDPVNKHHHPNYTPLHKVPDSAIKECKNYSDFSGKYFLKPEDIKTLSVKN